LAAGATSVASENKELLYRRLWPGRIRHQDTFRQVRGLHRQEK